MAKDDEYAWGGARKPRSRGGGFVDSVGERRRRERRRERAEARFLSVLGDRLLTRVHNELLAGTSYEELVSSIAERSVDPYTAAERVMERLEVR